jgi:hypothetical protein
MRINEYDTSWLPLHNGQAPTVAVRPVNIRVIGKPFAQFATVTVTDALRQTTVQGDRGVVEGCVSHSSPKTGLEWGTQRWLRMQTQRACSTRSKLVVWLRR